MMEQETAAIVIPSGLSPADAEECRAHAMSTLETAHQEASSLVLEVDGTSPTPVAVQLLVSTARTAERMNVKLGLSDASLKVLTETNVK